MDQTDKKSKKFDIPNILALAFIVIVAIGFILPNILESQPRPYVPRGKADMRTLANALESYYVEHKSYPGYAPMRELSRNPQYLKKIGGWDLMTIDAGRGEKRPGLTTPVAYVNGIPLDDFTGELKFRYFNKRSFCSNGIGDSALPFAYYLDDKGGWLIFSPGPDRDYDINPERMYDSSKSVPSNELINATYDPTNGSESNGDLWRTKD